MTRYGWMAWLLAGLAGLGAAPAEACRPFGSYQFVEDRAGGIWFTEGDNNAVSRLAPDGTVRSFPLPTPSAEVISLALDAKGNLWFAEGDGMKIGRLTRRGKITEFPVPEGHPGWIAADSKGNVWFTVKAPASQEGHGDHAGHEMLSGVGRLSAGGKMDVYPLSEGWATSLAIDHQDRVWVSVLVPAQDQANMGSSRGYVGTVEAGGKWHTVAAREGSCPMNLTPAPDGKLWISDRCRGTVEKIDVSGKTVSVELPPGAFAQKMSADQRGNLWFADSLRNRLAKVTPQGKIAEFPLPADNGGPFAILASRKGGIYFSETYNYNVNQLSKGVFSERLVNAEERRKEARETRSGEICYVQFGARIASKTALERKRAQEYRALRLKDSGDGASKLAERRCTVCHDLKRILLSRKTEWLPSITRMQEYMAVRKIPRLTEEEMQTVARYFNTHYNLGR